MPDDVAIVGYGDVELAAAPLRSTARPRPLLGGTPELLLAEARHRGPHEHRVVLDRRW